MTQKTRHCEEVLCSAALGADVAIQLNDLSPTCPPKLEERRREVTYLLQFRRPSDEMLRLDCDVALRRRCSAGLLAMTFQHFLVADKFVGSNLSPLGNGEGLG